jgi:hypothetical protein
MNTVPITRIAFPDIRLNVRDGHKLRGYFGNLFRDQSPLLSNHFRDGTLRYRYPLVQYKVIAGTPMLVGLGEGGDLLLDLFLKISSLDINGEVIPVYDKNITRQEHQIGVQSELHQYHFATSWMALNQENFYKYQHYSEEMKQDQLKQILKRNILNLYSAAQYQEEREILINLSVSEHSITFKNEQLLGFKGSFVSNALLPNYLGLGKSPARGFGTIIFMS